MKNDGLIDEIKSRIDIQDLISEYVELKRAGSNLKGLCPFHSEKTPSFMVNPARQIYHCFGCNKGGDIFSFLMEYENISFSEALERLAERAGVKIARRAGDDPNQKLKEDLYALNAEAQRFFSANLQNSAAALSYLKERGVSADSISQFSLGFAGTSRDSLMRHLLAVGFPESLIKKSGVVFYGNSGGHDFFRDRIIFPIHDLKGRIIAFGGRVLSSSKTAPKFINSPENPIFKKNETCYALHLAKNFIAQKGYSIIVEGYFDVIICHQFSFKNVVAPMGTALTSNHLRKLKKISPKIVFTFDADNAGTAAARRAVELAYAEGMMAKIAMLSKGDDPDTYLRKYGDESFRKLLAKAVTPVRFFISGNTKNRISEIRGFLSILSSCPDSLLRDDSLRELSDLASEKTLRDELSLLITKSGLRSKENRAVVQASSCEQPLKMSKEEIILINIALTKPELARQIAENVDLTGIESHISAKIFKTILSIPNSEKPTQETILSELNNEERAEINKTFIDPGIDFDRISQNINECLRTIALRSIAIRLTNAKSVDEKRLLLLEKKKISQKKLNFSY